MIIVALADIHDNIKRLGSIPHDLSAADVILLAGDVTNFGGRDDASHVVRAIREYNNYLLAVPGNCDYPEVDAYLTSAGINLHRKCITVNQIGFLGVGGSLPGPSKTPNEFTEGQLRTFLQEASANLEPDVPTILVSHQPPYRTVTDLARNGRHVGSQSIRNFITQVQPTICFTGHIHEGRVSTPLGKQRLLIQVLSGKGDMGM
jgi:Icc-related predicted phosphoesterase